MIINN